MHYRYETGMFARAFIMLILEAYCLAANRADIETDLAAQPLKCNATLLIYQYCQPHSGIIDIGQIMIKCKSITTESELKSEMQLLVIELW